MRWRKNDRDIFSGIFGTDIIINVRNTFMHSYIFYDINNFNKNYGKGLICHL